MKRGEQPMTKQYEVTILVLPDGYLGFTERTKITLIADNLRKAKVIGFKMWYKPLTKKYTILQNDVELIVLQDNKTGLKHLVYIIAVRERERKNENQNYC